MIKGNKARFYLDEFTNTKQRNKMKTTKQITIDEQAHTELTSLKKLYIERVGRQATFSEVIKNLKLKNK